MFLIELWIGRQARASSSRFFGSSESSPHDFQSSCLTRDMFPGTWFTRCTHALFRPARLIVPIFTSMFLHGSWAHLIFNMLSLWIFGDNVEDYLGHFRYIVLYLVSGVAAMAVHTLFNLYSTVPTVGASGAIAGVMGAYFLLYPRSRVLTIVPFFFMWFMWLPAWIVLGYFFVGQFLLGAASSIAVRGGSAGGVAVWAHVGGFLAGMLSGEALPFPNPALLLWRVLKDGHLTGDFSSNEAC